MRVHPRHSGRMSDRRCDRGDLQPGVAFLSIAIVNHRVGDGMGWLSMSNLPLFLHVLSGFLLFSSVVLAATILELARAEIKEVADRLGDEPCGRPVSG